MAVVGGGFVTFERALIEAIQGAERAFHRSGHVVRPHHRPARSGCKMGGLHPSDLLILAGRPGMGKTALATKIAFGAAKALRARPARSIRMRLAKATRRDVLAGHSAEQLGTRLLQRGVAGFRRSHPPRRHRPARLRQIRASLAGDPVTADRTSTTRRRSRISALRTRARRLKRTKGLALVVVDHIQLMRPAAGTKPDNRVQEMSSALPGAEGDRQGAGGPGAGLVAALACCREPRGQAPAACRPARVGHDRAGCRRGHVHLPR